MKIVVLDGHTENPGDLSWAELEKLGNVTVYDFSEPAEACARMINAEIVLTNKTVISREMIEQSTRLRMIGVLATGFNGAFPFATFRPMPRRPLHSILSPCYWNSVTVSGPTIERCRRADGHRAKNSASGIIPKSSSMAKQWG